MAQLHSPGTTVSVAVSHASGWPTSVPAPGIVRVAPEAKPVFEMLAGAVGNKSVVGRECYCATACCAVPIRRFADTDLIQLLSK